MREAGLNNIYVTERGKTRYDNRELRGGVQAHIDEQFEGLSRVLPRAGVNIFNLDS